jgi:hypothetical protein
MYDNIYGGEMHTYHWGILNKTMSARVLLFAPTNMVTPQDAKKYNRE